mmetsp:Transcript_48488/g.113491  ORF Transcript_48488/g.113491 Transcript_48488/m.113491 type:complete len:399 (+) Transcript_48488:62-1258(+)
MKPAEPLLPRSEGEGAESRWIARPVVRAAVLVACGSTLAMVVALARSSPLQGPGPAAALVAVDPAYGGKEVCENPMYSKTTVKTAFEQSFFGLMRDQKGEQKFEASDVIKIDEDWYYAIADSSWAIHKFRSDLRAFSADNILIGNPRREESDSGYEAIFHDKGVFFVLRESVKHHQEGIYQGEHHAIVEELEIDETGLDYKIKDQCSVEYQFEGGSKGFEGAVGLHGPNGEFYLVGLCEGNWCRENDKGKEKGNGRLVIAEKKTSKDAHFGCVWETKKEIKIPSTAYFTDYSAIAMKPDGTTVISSQESSQLWIGKFKLTGAGGTLDLDDAGFVESEYEVYDFPRDTNCKVTYCNVEGIHWVTDSLLVAVSDQMKKRGRQDFRCLAKDQSAHVFLLPR